jgi:hypothetical protein
MDIKEILTGAVAILIGLILFPVLVAFTRTARLNQSVNETIAGDDAVINLIAFGFAFGLVGVGISMIYLGFKK